MPEIVDRLRPRLRGIFHRYGISPEDAEDLTQDALVAALTSWPLIRNPETWLVGTLSRMCLAFLRNTRHRRDVVQVDTDALEGIADGRTPAQTRREILADLTRVCRTLPERQRRILFFQDYLGMTAAELAPLVGVHPLSVRKLRYRALDEMRRSLAVSPRRETAAARNSRPGGGGTLAERIRQSGGAGEVWMATVDAFLAAGRWARSTRHEYARHLAVAGAALGFPPLPRLSASELVIYRLGLAGSRPSHPQVLATLQSFLLWARGRREHHLEPDVIRAVLRRRTRQDGWAGSPSAA